MAGGRKIEFDKQQALAAAMRVFWKKGYSAASLSDLTDAMGINKPSLYSAFGNKESLFVMATDLYAEEVGGKHMAHLNKPDTPLAERLTLFLTSVIQGQCHAELPKGCYIALCSAETEGDDIPEVAQEKILEVGQLTYHGLIELFENDAEAISCGLNQNAQNHARFLVALMHGTSSMARTGEHETALVALVEGAIKGLGLNDSPKTDGDPT